MSTTEKLQNILNAKNAIKEKFGIGDDVKFIDYAQNINASTGGSTQYFRCAAVSGNSVVSADVFVSGAGLSSANGTYGLTDIVLDMEGLLENQKKVYSHTIGEEVFYIYYVSDLTFWVLSRDYNETDTFLYRTEPTSSTNPWEAIWVMASSVEYPPPDNVIAVFTDTIKIYDCSYAPVIGTYRLLDGSKTGKDRVWQNIDNSLYCIYYLADAEWWVIQENEYPAVGNFVATGENNLDVDNPVDVTSWSDPNGFWYDQDSDQEGQPPSFQWLPFEFGYHDSPPKTWNGYKAILKAVDLIVSGAEPSDIDGVYQLEDSTATGFDRVWKQSSGKYYIYSVYLNGVNWWLFDTTNKYDDPLSAYDNSYFRLESVRDPWNGTFIGRTSESGPTVVLAEEAGEEQVSKYYQFETKLTENLSWGDGLTPVVGGIYDADALISVQQMSKDITSTHIPETTGAEYFKCAVVSTAENGDSTGTSTGNLIVSGAGMTEANGTYTLVDSSATGYGRVWSMTNDTGTYTIKWYEDDSWYLDLGTTYPWLYCDTNASENPYDTEWVAVNGDEPAPTVVQEISADTDTEPDTEAAKVWSGYKAILKTETVTTEGETVIVVSGFTAPTNMNGTYILSNPTAVGTDRVWVHSDDETRRIWCNTDIGNWRITDASTEDYPLAVTQSYPPANDPTLETWVPNNGDIVPGDSEITLSSTTTEGTSKTVKYYEFEETLTKGLTYGDGFTPVVGKIYDREAMVEATLFEKYVSPISSPENMTDFENDEWLVSSTAVYDNRAAWQVFDGNVDTSCWLESSAPKNITWKNKKGKVLVKQIQGYFHSNQVWSNGSFVQGSNDGETWTDLFRGNFFNYFTSDGDKYKLLLTFPDNATAYQYHRIGTEYNSGNYGIIYELSAKSVID